MMTQDMATVRRPAAVFLLDPTKAASTYGPEEQEALGQLLDLTPLVIAAEEWPQHRPILAKAEIVLSGWGAPVFDHALMGALPQLRAVFYGAGSVKRRFGADFWERGAVLSCAVAANAVPVAEYTLSQIHWLLKDGYRFAQEMKRRRGAFDVWQVPGSYSSTVGLVSLSRVGALVARKLRDTDLRVIAYDPLVSAGSARELGVQLVDLPELFAEADVVSLHSPLLPETRGMIRRDLLNRLKHGARLINTARGAIIDHTALVEILERRLDLFAVLDVTDPEPLPSDSRLFDLPNVVLTPHIAGSLDRECARVGYMMVGEVRRFLAGEPLHHQVYRSDLSTRA